MKIHQITQGTPEWHAHRAQHFNASDAPAMLGVSPYKTRAELLREAHTGISAEVDAATQRRFDDGHRFEALARPLAEQIVGDDLYPVTGSEGRLSASFDGITLGEDVVFEHKTLNNELRNCMTMVGDASALPVHYRVQMEQQLLVSGADKCLFMATKLASDNMEVIEARHCWYYPDENLRAQIVAGWEQFAIDLAAYVPPTAEPVTTGRAPESLPALRIEVTGMVTASNLAEFKQTAMAAISSVNRDLKTDQDFADAEKAVKWCGEVESRLAAAKDHALSQTASIDELFKTVDDISAEARRVRLDLEKLVKARKDAIREEIVLAASTALACHVDNLNTRIGQGNFMPRIDADFAGAVKGKRSVQSLHDAVDAELARAKIEASAIADRIEMNLKAMSIGGEGFTGLFPDMKSLALKAPDDLSAVIAQRVAARKAAAEAERERIRDEERARAAKIEAERIQREQSEAAQQERIRAEQVAADAIAQAAKNTPVQDSQQVLKAELATADATAREIPASTSPRVGAMGVGQPADAGPKVDEPATLKLGRICERLGFTVTAAFLESLHIKHSATDKAAKLYRESDWPLICSQLIAHIGAMAELYEREAA